MINSKQLTKVLFIKMINLILNQESLAFLPHVQDIGDIKTDHYCVLLKNTESC